MPESVYDHIFGKENVKRDLYALSMRLYEHEEPDFDVEEWLNSAHPLDDHALEHPLVIDLANEDWSGPGAALAYIEEDEEAPVTAVVKWMIGGGYKGFWDTEAEFCADQFSGAVDDHFERWRGRDDVGFPWSNLSEFIDWEAVAEEAVGGRGRCVFYSIECEGGVYIFDHSISIDEYRKSRATE